ncbi:MAG: Ig-like domain-containing protein [Longimicrobiales bacterium]
MPAHPIPTLSAFLMLAALASGVIAQDVTNAERVSRLEARPATLSLRVGESASLTVVALDAAGQPVDAPVRVVAPRRTMRYEDGQLTAVAAGEHEVIATLVLPAGSTARPIELRIPVRVDWPAASRIEIDRDAGRPYTGTTIGHTARAYHEDGSERPNPEVEWSSSAPAIATVDNFGNVTALAPGTATISAQLDGARTSIQYEVAALPATRIEIRGGSETFRTGDVQTLTAIATDPSGRTVADVPVTWATVWEQAEFTHAGASAPGQVRDGRFVADVPGIHTVIASAGPLTARRTFRVTERGAVQKLNVLGMGSTSRFRTTDLWPFQGLDGRDYALTGTKVAGGHAFVWDITDPSNIVKTDSIQVDARTVNDVKVSPDGRYGIMTREGASNRRNGIVILDLASPAHPKIASVFENELTGGVHNAYATDDYLFAVSGGDKYVIIDVRDIYAPKYVSEYNHPDSRIHDVWVHDGLAYSAEWGTGVVVVDIGNGKWGGSIEKPVHVTSFVTPTGSAHAVFPYHQQSTGKTYLFVGDEIMTRAGLAMEGPPGAWSGRHTGGSYAERYDPITKQGGAPLVTQGYIQIFDFTNPLNAQMVARYEVTEYGTHNIWVEDDKLYQGYYEGGLRVVDVSGELMGNLFTQGREIAVFKPFDPEGYVANSPMVWSAIPYKGNIFLADTNSGLWAVKIQPMTRPVS